MFDFFINLFGNQIFQTIISGLILYILSQLFLELYLKPRIELRKLQTLLSEKLLTYQSKIVNGRLNDDQIKEIKESSAKLLSLAFTIYYKKSNRRNYLDISQNINLIVQASQSGDQKLIGEAVNCLNNLKKYKFLKATFE